MDAKLDAKPEPSRPVVDAKLDAKLDAKPEPPRPVDAKLDAKPDATSAQSLVIETYSEKAFVVRGDTKPFKDQLGRKGLGGKWNRKLRGGAGWIFRMEDRERVAAWMQKVKSGQPVEVAPAPAKAAKQTGLVPDSENDVPAPFARRRIAVRLGTLPEWMQELPRTPENPLHSKGAAAAMRKDLKKAFPGIKFSVKIGRGTGRAFIDCDWTDGPSEALVAGVVGFYDSRWNETLYAPIEDKSGRVVSLNRTYVDAISYHRSYSKSFLEAVLAQTDYTGEQRPAVVKGSRDHRYEFSKDPFRDPTLENIERALRTRRAEHSDRYWGGGRQKRKRKAAAEIALGAPQPKIAEKLRDLGYHKDSYGNER